MISPKPRKLKLDSIFTYSGDDICIVKKKKYYFFNKAWKSICFITEISKSYKLKKKKASKNWIKDIYFSKFLAFRTYNVNACSLHVKKKKRRVLSLMALNSQCQDLLYNNRGSRLVTLGGLVIMIIVASHKVGADSH